MLSTNREFKLSVFGVLAFLCVLACYRTLLPRLGRVEVVPGPVPAGEFASDPELATVETEAPVRSAVDVEGTPIVEPATAAERTPEEALVAALSQGSAWHTMDLSRWEQIDLCARSLELGMESTFGLGKDAAPRLAEMLERARSVRMRQFLLIALGVLEHGGAEHYAGYFEQEGLRGAAAFALGRRGGDRGVELLVDALQAPRMTRSDRDALYFGLGQAGLPVRATLLAATEVRLRQGAAPDDFLPLSFLRGEDVGPVLIDLARGAAAPGVRVAAIRAFARNDADGSSDPGWLHQLATDRALEVSVRGEAIRALTLRDGETGRQLAGEILGDLDAPDELVLTALETTVDHGIPRGYLSRIELLTNSEDEGLRQSALQALALAGSAEADAILLDRLPELSATDRATILEQIFMNASPTNDATLPGRRAIEVSPELYAGLARMLDENPDDASELLTLQVLAESGRYPELVSARAWERYANADWEDLARNHAILELSQVIGAEANAEIMQSFAESGEFVSRVELAACLANINGNLDDPDVVRFLEEETLPFLRDSLVRETGAMLAYMGPNRSRQNPLAMTIGNVFGRYGTADDLALLESLGQRFLEQDNGWPERLREVTYRGLVEAAGRGADLIDLREVN